MKVLVVYESMFGNTRDVANAIAAGVGEACEVECVEVSNAPDEIGFDISLLVVGGPTHAFGMTRPSTRKSAADQKGSGAVSTGRGIREWLGDLSSHDRATPAVAFDTRVKVAHLPGSAARGARKLLKKRGFQVHRPAESFWVTGTPGPLAEGELERARRWGAALGAEVARALR